MKVAAERAPWWKELNGYHCAVFLLAAFGWLFDCFDQQIFIGSRSITMRELLPQADMPTQLSYGGWATSIFIFGWATGGLIFGVVGDRWGRAKTMALTILIYAACTGLSGFAKTWGYFAAFRFLTGAGVGGEFAVGAALIAEVMPDRVRPHALGALQALTTVGNILAAVALGVVVPAHKLGWGWRGLYYLGALPGLLAVLVFWRLREPEKWVATRAAAEREQATGRLGRLADLFMDPLWRRHALVGLGLAVAGQIGLWGVAFYTPELIDSAIPTIESTTRPRIEAIMNAPSVEAETAAQASLSATEKRKWGELLARATGQKGRADSLASKSLSQADKEKIRLVLAHAITEDEKTGLKSTALFMQQVGSFFGIFCFTVLAAKLGRRISFLIALFMAWASLVLAFVTFHEPKQILYLWPILGFGTLAPFGGYAIYFPELFPTRLRTTGTSFCYNVGRYITAFGVFGLGPLSRSLDGMLGMPGFRLAALVLAGSYCVGIIALFWAPETVNQPLMEEETVPAH